MSTVDSILGSLRRAVFGISDVETSFRRRGFEDGTPAARARLESVGQAFVLGYNAALFAGRPDRLLDALPQVEEEKRGFMLEGAAMGLAVLDIVIPGRRDRIAGLLNGPGDAHTYMVHIGAGWALARLRRPLEPTRRRMDPLLGWLVVDGFGFHEGYFHPRRTVEQQVIPAAVQGYARSAFDQGLGRSLWFVRGADVARITATVNGFGPERRADLWSGVGLACAYAGGVPREAIVELRQLAGEHVTWLAQGAAFGAKARARAGNPAAHTELACGLLCGRSAAEAAAVTDVALEQTPREGEGTTVAYEVWRRRICAELSSGRTG